MQQEILSLIKSLHQQKYGSAKAVFWTGSVAKGDYTPNSDLDLIFVYDKLSHAYREAFVFGGWKIDAFIHDIATLRYFFEKCDKSSGILALPKMVLEGIEVTSPSSFSKNIKRMAKATIDAGPPLWNKTDIDKERFFITDKLDDILTPKNRESQIASAAWLYEALAQFYFRSKGKWAASSKSIISFLQNEDKELAEEFCGAFDGLFKNSGTEKLEILVNKILAPYGGLLWEGYRSDAPDEYRIED